MNKFDDLMYKTSKHAILNLSFAVYAMRLRDEILFKSHEDAITPVTVCEP